MKFKKGIPRSQSFFKSPEDFLPKNHLARIVDQIIDSIDLDSLNAKYSTIGQHAYHPKMLIKLLYYSYSLGISSSRKISSSCETHFDYIFLSNSLKPSHDRIANFRRNHKKEIKQIFGEVVLIGLKLGLIKHGDIKVNIDGTKIKASASSKLTKDEEGLEKYSKKIRAQILELLNKAETTDKTEDTYFGKNNRGDELPKKLQSKESRYFAIEKAKKELKKEKEELEKKELEKQNKGGFGGLTKNQKEKICFKKINITDKDAKFMKERSGVIKPNYNCQLSVDERNDFILANDVTTCGNDQHQLINMVNKTIKNIKESPKTINGDNGYYPELEQAVKKYPEIDFYIDDKNRRKDIILFSKLEKKYSKIQYDNLLKLLSFKGKKQYSTRMHTVESVNGNIKENLGFRSFVLRGLNKIKIEFNLMSAAHNIKKIAKHISESRCSLAIAISNYDKT